MSKGSTLYRFKISLSDVDRSVYETLDFRVAKHSSESNDYLLTRVLAYALNFKGGLEFSQGLAVPDDPAIRLLGENGSISQWIDIGNPSARRLHKASKAAKAVRVYTYKDPDILIREAQGEDIHRAQEIEVFSIDHRFLETLASTLGRENIWTLIHNDGEIMITIGDETHSTPIHAHRLSR